MTVKETGYQNYEMYNVTNTQEDAQLALVPLSPGTTSTRVVANFQADDGARSLVLEGSFNITGNSMADVHGTMTSITMYRDGAVFFSDNIPNGANFQAWVADYNYNLSLLGGNDQFTGTSTQAINDAVQALDGNDVFTGYGDVNGAQSWSGGDHFYGGNGIDTAVYRGNFNQYSVQQNATIQDARTDYTSSNLGKIVTDTIGNRDGIDKLVDVERLSFSDTNVAYDIGKGENAGEAYRIYKAAFDRAPDADGLGYWINALDHGTQLTEVAQGFINSQEFTKLYGSNPSDTSFIDSLYHNVLHRTPDQGGYDFWLNALQNGTSRAQTLVDFSESVENQAQTAPLTINGIQYHPYEPLA